MPRTMMAKQEARIRENPTSPTGEITKAVLGELDAERRISKQLAEALTVARAELDECADDTLGTHAEPQFREKVKACDAALAAYREGL